MQVNNLLIRFDNDKIDQTDLLYKSLKQREFDKSKIIVLKGNHLTPASIGIRKRILGELTETDSKEEKIILLINTINEHFSQI